MELAARSSRLAGHFGGFLGMASNSGLGGCQDVVPPRAPVAGRLLRLDLIEPRFGEIQPVNHAFVANGVEVARLVGAERDQGLGSTPS